MQNRAFYFTLIICLLACQAFTQDNLNENCNNSPPPLITVTGKASVRVQPDKVQVTVGIDQRAKTVKQVQEDVDGKSSKIISYLKQNGVEDRDVQTSHINLNPFYSYEKTQAGSTEVDFYTATKSLTFVLRDISKFEKVLSGLYEIGVNTVNGIAFQVENQEAARQAAKRKATGHARKIAESLTEGLGVSVGKVYSLNDQTFDSHVFPIVYAPIMVKRGTGDSETAISGGEVEITATVGVSFRVGNQGQFQFQKDESWW